MKITTARIHPELPIFRLDQGAHSYLYTPGHPHPVTQSEADQLQNAFALNKPPCSKIAQLAAVLTYQAQQSKAAWDRLAEAPFAPVCLTIYLSNRCNLRCSYCFAAPARMNGKSDKQYLSQNNNQNVALPVIREEVVEQAAQIVAAYCARSSRPLTLVLHGGGEPTLHWRLLQRLVFLTRRVAATHGIGWWGYLATNGILSENKAALLANHFDLIGLSCDGPPEIQDRQRPTAAGAGTSKVVERTARVFARIGTPFAVRATITPETVCYQPEIVRYIHEKLGTKVIRFEPAYHANGNSKTGFAPENAELFVTAFLSAQQLAVQLDCELSISGVRLNEIHGPYCNVLRDVLQLTPDGGVSGCFLCTNGHDAIGKTMSLRQVATGCAQLTVDVDRIAELRRHALQIPTRCWQCVNIYHCARECPEYCPAFGEKNSPLNSRGFRCQVYQQLAESWICQGA